MTFTAYFDQCAGNLVVHDIFGMTVGRLDLAATAEALKAAGWACTPPMRALAEVRDAPTKTARDDVYEARRNEDRRRCVLEAVATCSCPCCGASPGVLCVGEGDEVLRTHIARVRS